MILRIVLPKPQSKSARQQRATSLTGRYVLVIASLFLVVATGITVRAETFKARIVVRSEEPSRVRIEGERSLGTRAWSFRNAYANVMNLGNRIEKLTLSDNSGREIAVRKLAPGEYEAAGPATRFIYEVNVEAPGIETDAAHVSWLTSERGFLMLGDLLPLSASTDESSRSNANLSFVLPSGWRIAASVEAQSDGHFEVPDSKSAVFFIGQDVRLKQQRIGSMGFAVVTSGEWAFSDDEISKVAIDLLKDHTHTVGDSPHGNAMLVLSPFPRPAAAGHWSAETRGATVVLLGGKLPSRIAALAQLSFPLAHELFHLWIPNGVALDGEYDWFYEGFTLYQALRAGMHLNLLTFQDYLNAIGRAFDGYKGVRDLDKGSLLDASRRRWTSSSALVYNKGMLAAFLYDLTLRQQSKGKRSLDDIYRELFRLHGSSESRKEGNAAVLAVLNNAGGAQDVTRRYVESANVIDLPTAIAPFGLEVDPRGVRTHISVSSSLSGAQRDLLRKFGYNEKTYGVSGHRRIK